MATIKSARWPGLTLPSGHAVPWDKPLTVTNETLRQSDNARVLQGLVGCGDVLVTYDPDPEPKPDAPPKAIEASAVQEAGPQPELVADTAPPRPVEASAIQEAPPQPEAEPDAQPVPLEASAIQNAPSEPETTFEAVMAPDTAVAVKADDTLPADDAPVVKPATKAKS